MLITKHLTHSAATPRHRARMRRANNVSRSACGPLLPVCRHLAYGMACMASVNWVAPGWLTITLWAFLPNLHVTREIKDPNETCPFILATTYFKQALKGSAHDRHEHTFRQTEHWLSVIKANRNCYWLYPCKCMLRSVHYNTGTL